MKYPRLYRALKLFGHSPFKAAEILLDAKRGDVHALRWVRAVRLHESRGRERAKAEGRLRK